MNNNAVTKAAAVGVAMLVVLAMLGAVAAYRQVPEGHEGVEKEWGAVSGNTLESGAHWKIPVMESVQAVEVRPRTYTMSATEGEGEKARGDAIDVKTVNGSTVGVDLTVRYRVGADEADGFVEDWNDEAQMEQRLIRPTIRTVLRDEASSLQTTGDDAIYTQEGREALEAAALDALGSEFEDEPIVLEAVQIRNIDLPEEIDQALDEKEQAKQQVEVEKEKVKQEEAKKEQQVVRAEADAEAIEIRGEALDNNPIVLEQQYIEALENGNTIYVPAGEDGGVTLTRETGESTNGTATNSSSTNSTATVLP
jgi:regulator of protease activity HflC (stomatin/prohibitin superfamily)